MQLAVKTTGQGEMLTMEYSEKRSGVRNGNSKYGWRKTEAAAQKELDGEKWYYGLWHSGSDER